MRVDLFDYDLPSHLIAQQPLPSRHDSLLLAVDCEHGLIEHSVFHDLSRFLEAGDCLVLNSSRVRKARLKGNKAEGGGRVELLLLRKGEQGCWEALAKPARRLRPGSRITFGDGALAGEVVEKRQGGELLVRLGAREGEAPEELIEKLGEIPLPPYIKGELRDPERYQTVFASQLGSVAAPTAGLHFEEEDLRHIADMGVKLASVNLEVGLDTFRPMQAELVEEHRMHSEKVLVDDRASDTINAVIEAGGRIVAVGTTVVRALESCVSQGRVCACEGDTDLFIYPGFRFHVVDCVLTNFHMPRSSLLALVCAFAGRELVLDAYARAVSRGYRFLSLGDACFFHFPSGRDKRRAPNCYY
jgi:S-adenosylmethionine:tRNA ribosyltransferase-isomerase